MLIIIGFVFLLHLPTSELRQKAQVDFWREVSRMNSTQEFYKKYVNKGPPAEHLSLFKVLIEHRKSNEYEIVRGYEDTLQGSIQEESPEPVIQDGALRPCYPMNTSVPLPPDSDPRYERVPPCAILPRCGGCCGPFHTCLPTVVVSVPVTVYRGIFGADEDFAPVTLMMESHTQCNCSCAVLASDCNSKTHEYISDECLCRCLNAGQATSCAPQKMWDETLCRCRCRNLINCLDDEVFSFATCSCESKP